MLEQMNQKIITNLRIKIVYLDVHSFLNVLLFIYYICIFSFYCAYRLKDIMMLSKTVFTFLIITALIAEEALAKKKKSLCRTRYDKKNKQAKCMDIPTKRIPRRCRKYFGVKGKCENEDRVCMLRTKNGKQRCKCTEKIDY